MHFQKPMLGVPLDWSNPLNKGCVMHLAMNEGHGDVVRDLSMNGNHGTLNNMAFPSTPASGWNPGRAGVGLNFDGGNDYVDCGNDASLNISGSDYSSSVWVKFNSLAHSGQIYGRGWLTYNPACGLLCTSSQIQIRHITNAGDYDDSFYYTALNTGQWYHISVAYVQSTKGITLYIDGISVHTDTMTQDFDVTGNALKLGVNWRSSGNINHLDGSIDQVRIHNRALTAKEIGDYYINPWQVYLDK